MDLPDTFPEPDPQRKARSQYIRELILLGLDNASITARCIAGQYEPPTPQAIWRVRTYVHKEANPNLQRPTFKFLCKTMVESYQAGIEKGVSITRSMKRVIDTMELELLRDRAIVRRQKKRAQKRNESNEDRRLDRWKKTYLQRERRKAAREAKKAGADSKPEDK